VRDSKFQIPSSKLFSERDSLTFTVALWGLSLQVSTTYEDFKSLYQNEEWARCFLAGSWQGATSEDSRSAL
jgi:hypothetical protein